MKRIIVISLIIGFFSSIIFFIITYLTNNEFIAFYKTLIAFPAFSVVYSGLLIIVSFIKPVEDKKKDKKDINNVDFEFKNINDKEQD